MMLSPTRAHVQRALYPYTKSIIYIIQNLIYLLYNIIIKQIFTSKINIFNLTKFHLRGTFKNV